MTGDMLALLSLAAPPVVLGVHVRPQPVEQDGELTIVVEPLAPGGPVWLRVLRDCDGDRHPDARASTSSCTSPVAAWTEGAGADGALRTTRALADLLPAELPDAGLTLWLDVSRDGQRWDARAVFGVEGAPCAADGPWGLPCFDWSAIWPWSNRAPFDAAGQRASVWIADTLDAPARELAGSDGATGVAVDGAGLLVTLGRRAERPPGLYRVTRDVWRLLRPAPEGWELFAPVGGARWTVAARRCDDADEVRALTPGDREGAPAPRGTTRAIVRGRRALYTIDDVELLAVAGDRSTSWPLTPAARAALAGGSGPWLVDAASPDGAERVVLRVDAGHAEPWTVPGHAAANQWAPSIGRDGRVALLVGYPAPPGDAGTCAAR